MSDGGFPDALRLETLKLLKDAARKLELHPQNQFGHMSPHVALDEVHKLKRLARQIDALAEVAGSLKR